MEHRRFGTNIDVCLPPRRTAQIRRGLTVWRGGSNGRAEIFALPFCAKAVTILVDALYRIGRERTDERELIPTGSRNNSSARDRQSGPAQSDASQAVSGLERWRLESRDQQTLRAIRSGLELPPE